MEPIRKRLDFLRGGASVEKVDDALKAFRAAAKVADKASDKALASHDPADHAAASTASRAAATAAERAYFSGRRSSNSSAALHDSKQAYAGRAVSHDAAAKGDRGSLGVLHEQAAIHAKWGAKPDPAAEAKHAAAAINANLDAADQLTAQAAAHAEVARGHEAEGGTPWSTSGNRAMNARNSERSAQSRAEGAKQAAERSAKDHAAALAGAGMKRDEHGRFA